MKKNWFFAFIKNLNVVQDPRHQLSTIDCQIAASKDLQSSFRTANTKSCLVGAPKHARLLLDEVSMGKSLEVALELPNLVRENN